MIDIEKAFENRWRIKSESHQVAWVKGVKALCRDFFEAGLALSEPPSGMITVADATEQFAKEDFDYWWSLYDKKRGKDKCMQKWMKLSVDERKACISATPAYVASTEDKQYRKDPLTYLNGKCWNDEIIFRDNGKSTKPDAAERLTDILIG